MSSGVEMQGFPNRFMLAYQDKNKHLNPLVPEFFFS